MQLMSPARAAGSAIREGRGRLPPWLPFLVPSLVIFAVFAIYPVVDAAITSVCRYNLTEPDARRVFIGLANYRDMVIDPRFWGGLGRSFQFAIVSVTGSLLLGFYIAYLLNQTGYGKGLFRTVFLIPMSVSATITALAFKFMLNIEFGIINAALDKVLGIKVNFLGNPALALWSTAAIDIWQWTPLVVLILLAGLESLPVEVYEAAAIDGAGAWRMVRHVTLPLMKRFVLIAALIRTMDAFRVYETIQLTTAGGPGTLSETLNVYVAKRAFSFFEMGPASAMGLFLAFLIIFIATIFVRKSGAFQELVQ
jgi:multiple sugar transport system permease protein